MTQLDMYLAFRREIDTMAFPLIPCDFVEIEDKNGAVRGFLMVENGYIDGIWIDPRFRRRGLGRKAVLDYVKRNGLPSSLHTVKTNKRAEAFWKSVFVLEPLEMNDVDILWRIAGLK